MSGLIVSLAATLFFSAFLWRTRDVIAFMKWISSLNHDSPNPGFESRFTLWYLRISGLVGAVLSAMFTFTSVVDLVRK